LQRGDDRSSVNAIAFSNDSQFLATGQLDTQGFPPLRTLGTLERTSVQQGVQFWDPKSGLPLSPLESSVDILAMAFLPDGKTLLTFNHELDFRLWSMSVRTNIVFLRIVPGHEDEIWSVALAGDGRMLASGSKDGLVKVWKMEAFRTEPERSDQIEAPNIADCAIALDGRTMYSLSLDSAFRTWDLKTLQPAAVANLGPDCIVARISPLGAHLALGLTNGAVELWRIPGPNKPPEFSGQLLPPQSDRFRPFFITLKKPGGSAQPSRS
jgi:WD40 repeat protein